jgi:Chaperone of endosialidase
LTGRRGFSKLDRRQKDLNQAEELSPLGSSPLPDLQSQNQYGGETKGIPMNHPIRLKTIAPRLLVTLALLCFALLPRAQAVVPAPDGGYANFNTAEGQNALFSLTTGAANTAVGWSSLSTNAAGGFNTATGAGALLFNTGDNNTAFGAAALLFNTTGAANTAVGAATLLNNTEGENNTAIGTFALQSNTTSPNNTAVGSQALLSNLAQGNTAVGARTLMDTTTGSYNTAIGDFAMRDNVLGNTNTVVGSGAGVNLVNGESNTYVGVLVGDNAPDESSVIRIADPSSGFPMTACFIGGIFNVVPGAGSHLVVVAPNGQLADATLSSRRFKKDIAPIDKISEGILALKPVRFHFKSDDTNYPQFGLIAEEVAEVNPDWITRDPQGEIYGVRYETIPILLLNEFLKQHRKVEEQDATITRLKSTVAQQQRDFQATVAQLTARLEEQQSQIQEVTAQLEVSKPRTKVVLNNP